MPHTKRTFPRRSLLGRPKNMPQYALSRGARCSTCEPTQLSDVGESPRRQSGRERRIGFAALPSWALLSGGDCDGTAFSVSGALFSTKIEYRIWHRTIEENTCLRRAFRQTSFPTICPRRLSQSPWRVSIKLNWSSACCKKKRKNTESKSRQEAK